MDLNIKFSSFIFTIYSIRCTQQSGIVYTLRTQNTFITDNISLIDAMNEF